MTKLYGKALSLRFGAEPPPVAADAETPPQQFNDSATSPEIIPVEPVTLPSPEPRRRRILAAGEEARLGTRKTKRVAGLLRGGRNSPDWGEAVEWMGAKVPDGLNDRLAILARGHKLHRWQVLVEAIDCFERTHGPKANRKPNP